MSTFTQYVHVLQYDIIFPRFKEEKIDIDGDIYDIVWEEIDGYINETKVEECEELLFAYGFAIAMDEYDSEYGMDSLNGMESYRRVKCLLQCVIRNCINENIVEDYKKWIDKNMDKDKKKKEQDEKKKEQDEKKKEKDELYKHHLRRMDVLEKHKEILDASIVGKQRGMNFRKHYHEYVTMIAKKTFKSLEEESAAIGYKLIKLTNDIEQLRAYSKNDPMYKVMDDIMSEFGCWELLY